MEIIKRLSKDIEKEIDRAECYAKSALEVKALYPAVAEHYYKAANNAVAEITNNLHTAVVELIDGYRKEKGEPPADMKRMYEILHGMHMEHLAAVKGILTLYKEV